MKNKVFNFIKNNYIYIIAFIYFLILYFWYFKNIITIDTEDALLNPKTYYYGWIGQNRFSIFLINKFLSNFSFNILYRRIITFLIFYTSIIIIIKYFMKWFNLNDKKINFLAILIFGSSPIFAEQFYFTLQSIPISLGLLLESISLYFLDKYNKKYNKYLIIFSIINIFNFGLYQAFIPLYITIIIIYLFTHFDDNNKWKEIIKQIILFLINFCLYYAISYIMKKIIVTNEVEYIDSLIRWKDLGIISSILHIGFYSLNIIISKDYYHVLSFIILFIICIKFLINKKSFFKTFILITLFLSVFLLTILTASDIVFRSQFSYVFVLSFIFIFYYKISKKKKIFYILAILCLIRQSFFTYSLLYYDNIRYKDDIKLAKYTYNLSKKYPNKKIIFVGAFHNNKNVKIKGEALGHSFASWDYMSDYGVNGRFKSFMNVQDINVKMGSKEDYNNLKQYYDHEHYPSKNGYQIKNDYIIINLY